MKVTLGVIKDTIEDAGGDMENIIQTFIMLKDINEHIKEYNLSVTGSGVLLLRKTEISQLVLQNMQADPFRSNSRR